MPKGGPRASPKGSKIDEKEVSKRYLQKGRKKTSKMMISRTPGCGSSVVNNGKINVVVVFVLGPFWVSFWRCFGSPNGGQKHEKVVPKSHSKTGLKNVRNLSILGSHLEVGSPGVPEALQGSILEGLFMIFGAILC